MLEFCQSFDRKHTRIFPTFIKLIAMMFYPKSEFICLCLFFCFVLPNFRVGNWNFSNGTKYVVRFTAKWMRKLFDLIDRSEICKKRPAKVSFKHMQVWIANNLNAQWHLMSCMHFHDSLPNAWLLFILNVETTPEWARECTNTSTTSIFKQFNCAQNLSNIIVDGTRINASYILS